MPVSTQQTYGPGHFRRYALHGDPLLLRLEKEAARKDIPIVGPAMGKLLYLLARASNARRVLELGTSIGYSTIWLARAVRTAGGKVTSLEWDEKTAGSAVNNLAAAGVSESVEVVVGDALEWLAGHARRRKFDLIFNDIDKELYTATLVPIAMMLRPGGLAVFDNTAFRSAGDFLEAAQRHPALEVLHLHCFLPGHDPDDDAVTLCVKKGPN
jgi:predicted O-methyltransferase YrrM